MERIATSVARRLDSTKKFGYASDTEPDGKQLDNCTERNDYFQLAIDLSKLGFDPHKLKYEDAYWIVEENTCNMLRAKIVEVESMMKCKYPNGALIKFSAIAEEINYSRALNDLLSDQIKQYEFEQK